MVIFNFLAYFEIVSDVVVGISLFRSSGNCVYYYHNPDEKPPGGMRFLLITCLAPFNDGTVVLISTGADLYPSPVTGLPSVNGI